MIISVPKIVDELIDKYLKNYQTRKIDVQMLYDQFIELYPLLEENRVLIIEAENYLSSIFSNQIVISLKRSKLSELEDWISNNLTGLWRIRLGKNQNYNYSNQLVEFYLWFEEPNDLIYFKLWWENGIDSLQA